ncbi:MAG: hypothetical protein JO322_11825 [Candidatus Eremiobacteraeota bacterium]|nr:hypothetical protein [Candidatus Eremiobacteraeota bacterium]
MLVNLTCAFVLFVILAMIAAIAPLRRARNNARDNDGPETNLNIRALFDDTWKKH